MRHEIVHDLIDAGAVAVLRMDEADPLLRTVEALRTGGITAIEITMTTPNALTAIEQAATATANAPGVHIGVGSVLDGPTTQQALLAGAEFVVSPVLKPEIIETSHRYDAPAIPGAFTPSEVSRAHEMGADIVKIFPASRLGPGFFEALQGPMPHVKLMPTGGVDIDTAGDWIRAGACAVGVGSALLDEGIEHGDFVPVTENARLLRQRIADARG